MERMLSHQSVESKSTRNPSTLKGALEQLEINSLAPEFVAAYGTKDRACVDVMPSGLHSSEENRAYDDGRPRFDWGK